MQPSVKAVVDVELSMGQMLDDVKIALEGCRPVAFVGKAGGVVPTPAEVVAAAKAAIGR
jgi:2-oxoglutarate ferredoxin oxidoreductase subunit alpha